MSLSSNRSILLLASLLLISSIIYAQRPDSNDLFRGLPVVPYTENANTVNQIQERYGIKETIENRTKTLAFFNHMKMISEPSTISALTNITHNFEDYQKKHLFLMQISRFPLPLVEKNGEPGNACILSTSFLNLWFAFSEMIPMLPDLSMAKLKVMNPFLSEPPAPNRE